MKTVFKIITLIMDRSEQERKKLKEASVQACMKNTNIESVLYNARR